MSAQENKEIARRYMEVILSEKRVAAIDDSVTPDYVNHLIPPGAPQGPAGEKMLLGQFQAAFPDYRITVDDLVGDDGKVAVRWHFEGTHNGDFQGLPPTGRRVNVQGINILQLVDGRIKENWPSFDFMSLMQQLGAIPAPSM